MATELNRFSISVDDELLEKIDNYRYTMKIPARSQAIVKLIELGIKYLETHPNEANSNTDKTKATE